MNGLGVYMYDWTWNLGLIWGLVSFDPFDTWSWKVTMEELWSGWLGLFNVERGFWRIFGTLSKLMIAHTFKIY